jgi:diguanylate cyclase (GGDEF)-like protein/PAS domain S-box-containing protein
MLKKGAMLREESYSFSDLVDITTFSNLVDSIFKATGIPNGLVGPDGELITQSGWIDACVKFHRINPESCELCKQSNIELMQKLHEGEVAGCLCKNGLYDYATPIVIEGEQLATLFLGQVLHSPPDLGFFRKQAKLRNFEETAYIDAINAVPIVTKKQIEAHMEYMVGMAQMLATNGLAVLRETKLKQDLNRSTELRIQIEDLLEFSPVGISWCDAQGDIEYVNRHFIEMFGYTLEDLPNLETWIDKAYPDLEYREHVLDPWICQVNDNYQFGTSLPELESTICCKDGSARRVVTKVSWVGEKKLASFTDITNRWQGEQRRLAHGKILEMITNGEPLQNILNDIVQEIEAEDPGAYGSILLLDEEGKHLRTGAAPRLPAFYNQAIDGIEIGVGVGSCGTAAKLGKRVIVHDIFTHDYWKPYVDLAEQAGIAACWSEPIIGSTGKVLGTFAIYHSKPTTPNAEQTQLITFAASLAAVAIENHVTREALTNSERNFRSLAENAPINISRYDREGRKIYVNRNLASTLGKSVTQLLGKTFSEQPGMPYNDIFQKAFNDAINSGKTSIFEIEWPTEDDIETHLIHMVAERDEAGNIIGALATGLNITDRKRLEVELERQAHNDFLTGLANRRHFIEIATNELLRINRYGGELSLILFDIDFFKRINDSYGHSNGDLVLQKISYICQHSIREIDTLARIGGEEFVLLLPQTGKQEASDAAERLRQAFEEDSILLEDGTKVRFTASFGVVTINKNIDTKEEVLSIDDLLKRVDRAMYQAKERGRNLVYIDQNN